MKLYFIIAAALVSIGCYAQESKYIAPCEEKVIAYSGGVKPFGFDEYVKRCVTISEYNEKQRVKEKKTSEWAKNIREAQLLNQMDTIMKAKGLTDNDLPSCGLDIGNPSAEITNEQLEEVVFCLSLKKLDTKLDEASPPIICKAIAKESDVIISLSSESKFGRALNCISGDFAVDLTPCAPSGAYGLSAPTGSADLIRVANGWRDFEDHIGGVVGSFVSADQLSFTGGFAGINGYRQDWEFSVSRLTGNGQLKLGKDRAVKYRCSKVEQKF